MVSYIVLVAISLESKVLIMKVLFYYTLIKIDISLNCIWFIYLRLQKIKHNCNHFIKNFKVVIETIKLCGDLFDKLLIKSNILLSFKVIVKIKKIIKKAVFENFTKHYFCQNLWNKPLITLQPQSLIRLISCKFDGKIA